MVGPYNDHGWSQAHFDGGKYVEEKMPGTKMIYIDKHQAKRPFISLHLVDPHLKIGLNISSIP